MTDHHLHAAAGPGSIGNRAAQGLFLAGAAGACVLVYAVDPGADNDPYPACPFRALTGLACPGCGTLRATNRLLHGDLGAAFGLNALYVLMVPVILYVFAGMAAEAMGRPMPRVRWPSWAGYALLALVLLFWVARNIPAAPFTALFP